MFRVIAYSLCLMLDNVFIFEGVKAVSGTSAFLVLKSYTVALCLLLCVKKRIRVQHYGYFDEVLHSVDREYINGICTRSFYYEAVPGAKYMPFAIISMRLSY